MIAALRKITTTAINLVFPPSCVHCGREGQLLCHICVSESTAVLQNVCRLCAEPLAKPGMCSRCVAERPWIDRLYGSFLYETLVASAIKALKFDDKRALGTILGGMFNTEVMDRSEADVIDPVPTDSSRLRSRGFNQPGLFARMLSNRMEVAFGGDVLVRVGQTIPQSKQPTAAAKHGALLGAFEVRASRVIAVVGKRILIVDDVFTTGSTVKGCAVALKAHGASWVGVAASAVQPIGSLIVMLLGIVRLDPELGNECPC